MNKYLLLITALTVFHFIIKAENEPNNTLQQANNLVYNGSESGNLAGTDSEDWFLVSIPQGGLFEISIRKKGGGNGRLIFYDGEKTGYPEIANYYIGYSDSPEAGWPVTIPVLGGTYYVKMEKYSDTVYYQLNAALKAPSFPEDREPNDVLAGASVIQVNSAFSGTLHYYSSGKGVDQEDWYKIEVPQGGILTLKIHKKGPGYTYLHFRDGLKSNHPEISNFYIGYAETPPEGWTWSYPVLEGVYFFQIESGSEVVDYNMDVILNIPVFSEDTEPNDTITSALVMPVPGSVSGNIHYYVDGKGIDPQDWYRINVPQGGILTLKIHKKGPGYTYLHFRDGLKSNHPEISNFYIGYAETPPEGWTWSYPVLEGVYFFQIESGTDVVDYKLDIMLVAPEFPEDTEPNDTITKGLVMPVPGSVSGNVHYYSDGKGIDPEDWYKIVVPQGGILKLQIHKRGPGYTYLHFRDGLKSNHPEISNFYIGYAESPPEGWTWSYPVLEGVYFFQIESGTDIVEYKLDIMLSSPAFTEDTEPNDTITKGLVMPVPGSVSGNVHYYADGKGLDPEDWYRIVVPQGGILKLQIHKRGPGYTYLHFRDGQKPNHPEISNFYMGYSESPAEGWAWSYPVLSGIYYFQVESGLDIVDYKFDISLILPVYAEDAEPNDSLHLAKQFPLNDSITGIMGYYKPGYGIDKWDWFKVVLVDTGYLSFTIIKKGQNWGYAHLRDTMEEMTNAYLSSGDIIATIEKKVLPGKNYLGIENYTGEFSYKVKMNFTPIPKAAFTWVQTDNAFTFENTTIHGVTFEWDFDDGIRSTAVNPSHTYNVPGNYDVSLMVRNIAGIDTTYRRVINPGVTRIFPVQGGNSGDVTVQVFGGGLDTTYHIRLEQNGVLIATAGNSSYCCKSGISATFDLRGKQTGICDVVVFKSGGPAYRMPDSFTILSGNKPEPWARLEGRNRILFNTPTTYNVVYGNSGNVDATGIPLWIAISDLPGLTIEFTGINIKIPDYVYEKNLMDAYNSVDLFFTTDSVSGKPFKAKVYVFYIPVIPAGTTGQLALKIKTGQNIKVQVWVNDPYYESPMKGSFAACVASVFAEGIIDAGTSAIPAVGCVYQGLKSVYTVFSPFPGQPEQGNTWGSWLKGFAVSLVDCGISLTGVGAIVKATGVLVVNSYLASEKLADCKKAFLTKNPNGLDIDATSSLDPNEKTGPSGWGSQNYIPATTDIPYTVYFENKANATAPAHTVIVTDQLDITKFDLSSCSFGTVAIGDSTMQLPSGLKKFVFDKKLDNLNVIARISGQIDSVTGMAEWKIRSLDPVTFDDIEDPDLGILPPNLFAPQGEGSVSFNVRLKEKPVHKSVLTNHASIVFDANPAITTNDHMITFDLNAPVSLVHVLPDTTRTREFRIHWSGTDDGSGINMYHIYVKSDTGSFQPWISTADTSAVFHASGDHFYQFVSEAVDQTGNSEPFHTIPDASTRVYTGQSCLKLQMKQGWNIVSINNTPDTVELKQLFQPLINRNSLIKIQDETGKSLEDWGVFGGWINNIGNISITEGYKIKVRYSDSLNICGSALNYPFLIPLKPGWNVIGYPHFLGYDGKTVVQRLIDRGRLIKVQDESGNSIEDWGVFGGWKNNIGNFKPGEGYKIKVKAADTLRIEHTYPKSGTTLPAAIQRP